MNVIITTSEMIKLSFHLSDGGMTVLCAGKQLCDFGRKSLTYRLGDGVGEWLISARPGELCLKPRAIETANDLFILFDSAVNDLLITYSNEPGRQSDVICNKVTCLAFSRADKRDMQLFVGHNETSFYRNNPSLVISESQRDDNEALDRDLRRKDSLLQSLLLKKSKLQQEIDEKDAAISAAQQLLTDAEDKLIKKKAESERIQAECDRLQVVDEAIHMDTQIAEATIAELKERLLDDKDTVALADDLFKRKKPVTIKINELLSKIEALEKEIGLIIGFQEKINERVHKQIADSDGDGFVNMLAGIGGRLINGNSETVENTTESGTESIG